MLFDGNFYNNRGDEIKVVICTKGDNAKRVEIGNEKDGIFFTDDPVEITSQANDTFDHLLCYQASVRLLCKNFVPEFFCSSCRDAVVNILRNGECIFVGYVEPQAFSQGYNEDYDEVELTCIDCLSALSYSNYRNVGAAGVLYDALKGKAAQRTFYDIIAEILNDVGEAANYMGGTFKIMYDGSKALSNGTGDEIYNIFQNISINELLFFGDEEDDMWTQEDVLNEILKYLNLHIVQEGTTFYIFSWESIRKNSHLNLYRIDEGFEKSIEIPTYRVGKDIEVADCDTKISIGETYNELLLTDNVTEVNDVIESPLDDDSLIAAGNFQKYMTEYIAEGEGRTAYNSMYAMTTGRKTTDWQGASQVDWFCWPKAVANWKFYGIENGSRIDMYEKYPADGTKQQDILNKGLTAGIGACVCAFGKIERKNGGNTSSLVTSVSMDNYLIISTMGRSGYPSENDILASCPVAEYTGNKSGGTFSPVDGDTINYIVISGKMVLNPVMDVTDIYYNMSNDKSWNHTITNPNAYWHKTVPSRNNKDGRYYTRKYWESEQWNQEPVYSEEASKKKSSHSFYPYTGTGPQEHEYAYSAVGVATDTIKRVGLISCMLIIGDKCVVECNKGDKNAVGGTSQGEGDTDDFVWKKYKERSECASDDEYYAQSFTIGIDPELRDKIIGTEFEIRKNAPYTKGITAEGTAIPIRMSDHVSGSVQFKILGPVNAEWNEITRRHPSFWRHTKWYQDSHLLLQEINSIMLKEFKIEVVSDNGKIGAVSDEKDIVYKSDTGESFVNRKDDLEFRFTTALTSKECKELGVNNAVKLSSPQNEATKNALADIYDRNQNLTDKPEKLYVDAYWQEWHEPRVVMTQNVIEPKKGLSFASIFSVPVIGKRFYVQGIDRNLTEGTAVVTMRELF